MQLLRLHTTHSFFFLSCLISLLFLNDTLSSKEIDSTPKSIQHNRDRSASLGVDPKLKGRAADKIAPRSYSTVGDLWPRGFIPYCFQDQQAKERLESVFDAAVTEWQNAWKRHLPQKPFPVQFHSRGVLDDSNPDCHDGSVDLMMIWINAQNEFYASVGYQKGKRMALVLHDQSENLHQNVVHELGHVMGLLHEHQRPDAATYVTFLCENLFDYQKMVDKYEIPGGFEKGYVKKTLCTNIERANLARFFASELAPAVPATENETPDQSLYHSGFHKNFDFESIMIYSSWAYTKAHDPHTGEYSPTLKRVSPVKVGDEDSWEIVQSQTPSAGDIAMIDVLYDDNDVNLDITADLHGLSLSGSADRGEP